MVLFARSEKVKVTSENEEAVLGIGLYMASVLDDGAFDAEYLRRSKTKIVNIPVDPAESFTGRSGAQYSPQYKMVQRKVILRNACGTRDERCKPPSRFSLRIFRIKDAKRREDKEASA